MGWITDHPPQLADLDACVACGLCLPVCPTFRLTGDESASPRGRLAAIAAVGSGAVGIDGRFEEITSFCLQCRACETACPSHVPYGEIIESARSEAVEQVGASEARLRRRGAAKRVVLGWMVATRWVMRSVTVVAAILQRVGLLTRVPIVGRQAAGMRTIPVRGRSSLGGTRGDPEGRPIIVFVGCVADVWFGATHAATIDVLVRAGYRVDAVASQTCCGALAAHAGLGVDAGRLAGRNIAGLEGSAPIVVDVAGCGAHLKGYGRYGPAGAAVASRTRDITEVVAEAIAHGDLPILPNTGRIVAVQDPCHLEHGQRIVSEPRTVVTAAGYTVVDADAGGLCCGAAGTYQIEHDEAGAELGRRKADAIRASGSSIVASANAGCEMQLRRFLDDGYTIVHPVELYAAALADHDRGASPER